MRFLLGLAVFLMCLFLGYQKILPLKKRRAFYVSFNNFNLVYKNAVSFERKTLFQIVENSNAVDDFNQLLKAYILKGQLILKQAYLTNEEKEFLTKYLEIIGKGNASSQLEYVDYVYKLVDDKRKQCVSEEVKNGNLYLKLSILIGLMLFILVL